MSRAVRVRFAPSPTGYLHIGGLRTALYNYSFARRNAGKFILRIEDTDQARLVPGSVESLIAALRWCGIEHDEGPAIGGPYGPYVQSERLNLYTDASLRLLESGHAYRCFCSSERLDDLRKSQTKRGRTPLYDRTCTRLAAGEAERRAAAGERHVIRLLVPPGSTSFRDIVRGSVTFNNADVDDQVLLKSDGWPTYHLASVVDDTAMDISHVIRGQEWLPSTPKHLMLYAAMGVPPPTFAHLPILLNPDRSKLSKRSGDASVEDFKASGYTARALTHFVALLGWTPPSGQGESGRGDNVGLLDLSSITSAFTLEAVHKGDSIVDRAKLDSLNAEHVRLGMAEALLASKEGKHGALLPVQLDDTAFLALLRSDVIPRLDTAYDELMGMQKGQRAASIAARLSTEHFNAVLLAQHERVRPLSDFVDLVLPFLVRAAETLEWVRWTSRPQAQTAAGRVWAAINKKKPVDSSEQPHVAPGPAFASVARPIHPALVAIVQAWQSLPAQDWLSVDTNGESLPLASAKSAAKSAGTPAGRLLLPLRLLLTGLDVGAGIGDSVRLLGRDECVARLQAAVSSC